MKRHVVAAATLVACLLSVTVAGAAPVKAPIVQNSAGQNVGATPVITVDESGAYVAGGGGSGGDASAANQTAVQATAGSDASKAVAVQGVTGGKAVPVSASSLPLPTGAATATKQDDAAALLTSIQSTLDALSSKLDSLDARLTDVQTAALATSSSKVQGGIAADSAASENPLPNGCRASSTTPTAVSDGDVVNQRCTVYGGTIAWPYTNPENLTTGLITTAMTGTTSTAVSGMGAQGAGIRNYVTEVSCANTHASVDTLVNIQDGSGGTVIAQLFCPHGSGHQKIFPAPLRQPTANTALYAVDVTTGASVTLSASGFKAP